MKHTQEPAPSSAARRAAAALREAPTPHYDVNAGLARHRALLAQGTLPAAHAAEGPLKSLVTWGMSKVGLSTLVTLTLLSVVTAYIVGAESRSEVRAPRVHGREVSAHEAEPSRPSSQPSDDHAPAPQNDRGQARTSPRAAPVLLEERPAPAAKMTTSLTPQRTELRAPASRAKGSPAAAPKSSSSVAQATLAQAPGGATPSPLADAIASSEETPTPEAAAAPVPAAAPSEDPTEQEMRELAQAQRLLRAFPRRALDLARTSDQRFKPGYLRQERRLLIVKALLASKRRDEAERQATTFEREDPDAAFRARLEALFERPN